MLNKDGTSILRNYLILTRGRSPDLNCKLRDGDEIVALPPPFGGG